MIDHVSIEVAELKEASEFYERVLATIGFKKLIEKPRTSGFGKKYPEFWLNHRPNKGQAPEDTGFHVCLRASSIEAVNMFHKTAIENGAKSGGDPGFRPEYHESYYAAFIKDKDQNHIEVVTFVSV
ncbi:MAG: catechol 2,3-dioxygenase-like lactoylglutathione lyase family enzyme [Paracoccaceae bacterium]|jgi:predicted lactoylglutathione lyase